MKRVVMWSVVALVAAAAVWAAEPEKAPVHPDSAAWEALLSMDLANAIVPLDKDKKPIWTWQDGVLTASADQNIWTKREFGNCVVDLEFKTADGTNSGVIVYCSNHNQWIPNSVEIQIADDHNPKWAKSPKTWQCAAAFGHQAPTKSAVKKPGEWNRLTITCQGPQITIALNGEVVNQIDMKQFTSAKKNPDGSDIPAWLNKPLAELPNKGRVGLQGKHAGAPIFFRNLKIKALD